jgi:ankyrin repeat protein
VDKYGYIPLHVLCRNKDLDEDVGLYILKLLLEKFPESVRQTTNKGNLPLHIAAKKRSPEFCRILIEAYPESERMANNDDVLPFHWACQWNTVATVEYLYKLHPESINVAANDQSYPIHYTIGALQHRRNPETAIEVVKFLLDCNRDVVLQKLKDSKLPLYLVCKMATAVNNNAQKRDAYLKVLQILYDAYPEAIERVNAGKFCAEVQTFINTHSPKKQFNKELRDFCRSESLSEDGLREIIERYNIIDYHRSFIMAACRNELVTERVLRYLLEHFPKAASFISKNGSTPLHAMSSNKNATPGMMQLLIDACPGSLRRASDDKGWMPIHALCHNNDLDDLVALNILRSILEKCPGSESVRNTTKKGNLPLHFAALRRSPEFCHLLIEAYPGSERIKNCQGHLPLHAACEYNNVATVKCLLQLYPESNEANSYGDCPINYAVWNLKNRSNPSDGIEVVQLLMDDNPDALSASGETPLHIACSADVSLEVAQLLIDVFPESLLRGDNVGYAPLHDLCENKKLDEDIALEILKLLLEKRPESVRHLTNKGNLPLHIAAMHQSPEFCRSLIEAYPGSERISNGEGELPLHIACQYNNLDTVKYLLQLYPESNVADADGICPIHYAVWNLKDRSNPSNDLELIQLLLDDNPDALLGQMPLHIAFGHQNESVDLDIVQLLIAAFPDSLHHVDNNGFTPLHELCFNEYLDEDVALDILKLLIEKYPGAVRHADEDGDLPIHIACCCSSKSPNFCRILIEAYPGSERITNGEGELPFQLACRHNSLATVKYLLEVYPESSELETDRFCPIHCAIWGIECREDNPETAVEVVKFLLDCNPKVVLQKYYDEFPLYWVCVRAGENAPTLNAYLEIMQLLYDAYPEAIEEEEVVSNVGIFCQEVQTFINTQLAYARQATDHRVMTTPDESGQLPLHRALRDNATLGSIKLLVKGNPSATRNVDNRGMIPLHVACQHHSPSVVEYLIDLNSSTLKMKDLCQNTALHHACRGSNHVMIAFLLEKYDAAFVASKNSHMQIPIDLLFYSDAVSERDGEDIEYMESIYRLIRANPETVMGCNMNMNMRLKAQFDTGKRKFDHL